MFMYLNYKVYMTVLIMLLKEFIYVIEFYDGYFDKIKQLKKINKKKFHICKQMWYW